MANELEKFSNHFLNCIIAECIHNTEFLREIIQVVPIETYRSPVRQQIAQIIYDFFWQYKTAPKDHF